ncbi:MAG TPA: hypothetical protein DIC64_05160 [Alphaproteobacteria bacterium]|nr:hypothetical protein [Alphaproteobacteria bacterium]
MEKWIHRISFVLTFAFMYVLMAYVYLSFKGFVYQNGTFELVKKAEAGILDFAKNDDEPEKKASAVLARNVALNLPQTIIAGDENAPLTIFEFSSLACTHCADFHLNGLKKLEKEFTSQGKVKVVFIHFPLDRRSMQAAMLAECVDYDKKADFLNLVFSKQREWVLAVEPEKDLINYAIINGLSAAAAEKCLKNDDLAKEIISNRQEAIDKLKIEGTPAFLISTENKNEIVYGISNINDFKNHLRERLEEE